MVGCADVSAHSSVASMLPDGAIGRQFSMLAAALESIEGRSAGLATRLQSAEHEAAMYKVKYVLLVSRVRTPVTFGGAHVATAL